MFTGLEERHSRSRSEIVVFILFLRGRKEVHMAFWSVCLVERRNLRPFSGRLWLFGSRDITNTFPSFRVRRSGRRETTYVR
jgi:hypothetical protein